MADSTAFNFGGVWTPTYDGEPGVQQYETVGQFDVRYWEEYNGGVAGGGQNTQASMSDADSYFEHSGFVSDDISAHLIQTGNYTENDNFMGSLEHQFGILEPESLEDTIGGQTNGAPGASEIDNIETYQYIADEDQQAYVSNTMNIETEHNTISLHFDKIDYIDPTGTTDLGGAMTKDIEIIHYDDGLL